MTTRDFSSDEEVQALVDGFESCGIAAAEFTHAAHIAVGLYYLAEFPPVVALSRMRKNIRAFAAHHRADSLYHETITTFWMRLLDHLASAKYVDLPLWQRINVIVADWGTRRPVEAHYTPELISSAAARERWMPPDREPLPF